MSDRKIYWRCFHCGDAFTKAQERWAREHFGRDQGELPVCQMRIPGEHHLLAALRSAQDELERYRCEDTDLMRALYAQAADHAVALKREEERGYGRGLHDARVEYDRADAALSYIREHEPRCYTDAGGLARREAFREVRAILEPAAAPSGVTATGVSADPGGTETKPEQNLHEKGSEG